MPFLRDKHQAGNETYGHLLRVPLTPVVVHTEWVPNDPDCPLEDWSIPVLCRLLERTNVSSILFVGDSITFQHAQSFYKMGGGLGEPNQLDP
jgi:hypothetical protein